MLLIIILQLSPNLYNCVCVCVCVGVGVGVGVWVCARLTLCDPIDCSPPGFFVHGIILVRILE